MSAKALASVIGRSIATGLVNPHEPLTAAKLLELCDVAGYTQHGRNRKAEYDGHFSIHKEARRTGEDVDSVTADVKRAREKAEAGGADFNLGRFLLERAGRIPNRAGWVLALADGPSLGTPLGRAIQRAIAAEAKRTGEPPAVVESHFRAAIEAARAGGVLFVLPDYLEGRAAVIDPYPPNPVE